MDGTVDELECLVKLKKHPGRYPRSWTICSEALPSFTALQDELIFAVDAYRRVNNTHHVSYSETLAILLALGYRLSLIHI